MSWEKWNKETELKRDIAPKVDFSKGTAQIGGNHVNNKSSNNIVEPLIDCMLDSCKLLVKYINQAFGCNKLDFSILFKEIDLKNKSGEYPKLINYKNNEHIKIYKFRVPVGIGLNDFTNKIDKIAIFIGYPENNIRIEIEGFYISVKVLIKVPRGEYDPLSMKRNDFKIPLGYNVETMQIVYWDIIKASNTHMYLAGSSGGGKSIMLRLILCHLINSKSKRDIELSIINTKRVDLKDFERCKHTKHYMTGSEGVETFLEDEVEEMERRYKLIDKYDCDDLTEYRERINKIPYRFIVVEEISSYKGNKGYQRSMELISSQGRGAGMILLLVTQLPSHEIMPNTIKCNINTTIGLKTKDEIRSDIIAPNGNLQKLKGDGHAKLFDSTHDGTEYQGFYISKEIMKEIIDNNLRQNKRVVSAGTLTTHGDNKEF